MNLNLTVFPSSRFTYCADTKTLVAEASDLNDLHLQRLYDDACDVGLAIKSDRTGAVVIYVMSKTLYHGNEDEREISGWEYVPSYASTRAFPDCIGTRLTIFND